MNKYFLISLLALFKFAFIAEAQQTKVVVDNKFKFHDGLFLTFEQVKDNNAIPVSNIIASGDKSTKKFWDNLFQNENIYYIDETGEKKAVESSKVFGFAFKGKLYIRMYGATALVPVLGKISHFIIAYNVTEIYDPFYDPLTMDYPQTSNRIETKQMIIDFDTGQILDFNVKNIEPIFARDTELFSEWSKLSKRKKKKLIFVYLQKYNQKHKLLLPK